MQVVGPLGLRGCGSCTS